MIIGNFNHQLLDKQELFSYMTEQGRVYKTPFGDFPSVTTIIDKNSNKEWLKRWQDRIGKEKANAITEQSKNRGTALHNICETYLSNTELSKGIMPINLEAFLKVKPFLDRHVSLIYGIEFPLWSRHLKTAGRTDLICRWDDSNAIVDFKTSNSLKKESDIKHYFIQSTVYSIMLEERYNIKAPNIVIIMIPEHENPKIFVKKRNDYVEESIKMFTQGKR